MTLSPVFRSDEAVQILRTAGVWSRLDPAARGQAEAISRSSRTFPRSWMPDTSTSARLVGDSDDTIGIEFVQEFFFLILFRSVLQTVGVTTADLRLCCELNFCIKGTITAADNLFDDQDKALLPLRLGQGFALSIDPPAARLRAAREPCARARRQRRLHFHRLGRSIPEGAAVADGRDRFPGGERGRRRRGRDGARPDDRTGPPCPRRRAVRARLHRASSAEDLGRSGSPRTSATRDLQAGDRVSDRRRSHRLRIRLQPRQPQPARLADHASRQRGGADAVDDARRAPSPVAATS